jgi:TPR repeat protein
VTQNYERAAFWFRLAAEKGIANAAYNLGVLNQQGLGQEQDIQQALDWYRRAALAGHPEAQYNLGISYIEGVGTRYNPSMAAAFFEKAAFAGIVEAAYNLGLILENGLLGEVRTEDAMIWYRAAAENGNLEALQALQSLAQRENIPMEEAGFLENGESLANYTNPLLSEIEPAAGEGRTLFEDAMGDVSLGTLIPTEDQILVAQIQEQLRKARLYNGPQDGIVGAGTVKAIRTYQRQNNLPVDGQATPELFTYMLQQGTIAAN